MPVLVRTWRLANGLQVEIFDHPVSCYGDRSTIKLTICCDVEVKRKYVSAFETHPRYREIMEALGDVARYRREVVKAGVPAKHLSIMKSFLVEKFEENALAYFEGENFPQKYVARRFTEIAAELAKKDRFRDGS
jgi:hypothetical protein